VSGVGLNPRRTALLQVLRRMGAEWQVAEDPAGSDWEPRGDIEVIGRRLRATEIGGDEIPNLIDEIPILAAIAALAEGRTVIRDAAELRVKESDRIASLAANLRLMGVEVEEFPDGLAISGPATLTASAGLRSYGDHRIAMAMAILGLSAPEACTVLNTSCVQTSYPDFWRDLNSLGAQGK
jgi:3-phosphoshikimate 1-carboxyvinyltransferase